MRRALISVVILTLLLVSPAGGEISHEDYDRARMNLQIVHLFLSAAFSKAEASAEAAAEGDLYGARENLTYFKRGIEGALRTLEEVSPEVPSYSLIKKEIENLSSLYTPLLNIVEGYLDLNGYLAMYENTTVPYSALLEGAESTLENITSAYDLYRAAEGAKARTLAGVEALPDALQNVSSAYNTTRIKNALRVVGENVASTTIPPFILQALPMVVMKYEGDVAISLFRLPHGGEVCENLSTASASLSSTYTSSTGGLKGELSRVVPELLEEYRYLLEAYQQLPELLQARSAALEGNFYLRIESAHTSLGIVQRMAMDIEGLNRTHSGLLKRGLGNTTVTSAILYVMEWLTGEAMEIYQRINFTGEIEFLANLSSRSLFHVMWDYDGNGNGRLDISEITSGWNISLEEKYTRELSVEVSTVREAFLNFTTLFPQEFLRTFSEMEKFSGDLQSLYIHHRSFLISLESAVESRFLERLKEAWTKYGELNSTLEDVLLDVSSVEASGADIDNTSVERAVEMLRVYREFLEEFGRSAIDGLFVYTSSDSYPLGDVVKVYGYAYHNGPLSGWLVNVTVLNRTVQVRVSPTGAFSANFEIPLNTTPGRHYLRATMGNMTTTTAFSVTLIPVKLTLLVDRSYALPGERINLTFVAEDLWGVPIKAGIYVDEEKRGEVEGRGNDSLVIENYGLHRAILRFPGDGYHPPAASTPYLINISIPLNLTLLVNTTTLFRNSTINITVVGAPPGRVVSLIATPSSYVRDLTSPSWSFNITLRWGELPPGEYLLRAVYRAQDPVYRDSESLPVVIVVVNYSAKEPAGGGEVAEMNSTEGGIEVVPPLPRIPVPLPERPRGGMGLVETAFVIILGVSVLLLSLYVVRGRGRGSETAYALVEERIEEEEESEAEEDVEGGVETAEIGGEAFTLYWEIFQWARSSGAEVHEYMTPRELANVLDEVRGGKSDGIWRFVELFEVYVYSPRGDESHLQSMREILSEITGGGGGA